MEDTALLLWLDRGRTLAYFLVAVGVVGEFLVDRISDPIIKRRDREQRAEIARALDRAASAEERAAELNKKAEEERLARITLEERIAPRHVSVEQRKRISAMLTPFKGKKIVVFIFSDFESGQFADELILALAEAGIEVGRAPYSPIGEARAGITFGAGDNQMEFANAIADALVAAHVAARPVPIRRFDSPEYLVLTVGPKP